MHAFDEPVSTEDYKVVMRLANYVGMICEDSKLANAQEVADLFKFGIKEDPQIAAARLRHFVANELPDIEAVALRRRFFLWRWYEDATWRNSKPETTSKERKVL